MDEELIISLRVDNADDMMGMLNSVSITHTLPTPLPAPVTTVTRSLKLSISPLDTTS